MNDITKNNTTIKKIIDIEFTPIKKSFTVKKENAIKFPLDKISSYGINFATLASALSSALKTMPIVGETLYRATDSAGNAVKLTQMFKDGSGFLGSSRNFINGFQQFRFHEVASVGNAAEVFNPSMIIDACAMVQINLKLDSIMDMQKEIFDYIKIKDYAKQKGDMKELLEIINDYKYYWEDENYRNDKIKLVQEIKRSSEQWIAQYNDLAKKETKNNPSLYLGTHTKRKANSVAFYLKGYQTAIYIYSFSVFLEKILRENFQKSLIDSAKDRINKHISKYLNLVDLCQRQIIDDSRITHKAGFLNGIVLSTYYLGNSTKDIPILRNTSICQKLIDASKDLHVKKWDDINKTKNLLGDCCVNESQFFVDSLNEISRLYNGDIELLSDGKDIYLLPC